MHRSIKYLLLCLATVTLALVNSPARAIDFEGVQAAAFDQPQINALFQPVGGGNPYQLDFLGIKSFNIVGFLDTGASGIVIGSSTADLYNIPRAPGVTFHDVAIGGFTEFDVSQTLNVRTAPSTAEDVDNLATYQTVYNQSAGPLRIQIGPTNVAEDPFAEALNVIGMPVMMGKTLVMDPRPANTGLDFMHTFIYDQNTPFNAAAVNTNPGIPSTSHQVQLSYGDFGRFTETLPAGAQGPQINHNPFLGPNPLLALDSNSAVDNTPPVTVSLGGVHAEGSFLLETGAAASFIPTHLAAQLHVRYVPGTFGGDNPLLEMFDPLNPGAPGTLIGGQFSLPIQGIGGQVNVAGFFLDDMVLQTLQGSSNLLDPNNIRYVGAPVLVNDITVFDPLTNQELTLDGIFGMNFLAPSASLETNDASISPYNWITFDEPNGILGLDVALVPEPSAWVLAASGAVLLFFVARRRRKQIVAV